MTPDFETFKAGYDAGHNQIVYTRLTADLDTPVSLMLKLTGAGKHAFLLESVTGGEIRGRYSIVGMKPDLIWECHGTNSRINRTARFDDDAFEDQSSDPLANLRALIAESKIDLPVDLPAASAGLFGYLGYDMIRLVEHLPDVNPDLGDADTPADPVSNFSKSGYLEAVEKAKDYIRAGDIFQCVPSQRWTQTFSEPPFALYRSLRRTNPSPFMFYFNYGDYQVIGASPEILVRVFGNEVTIRPIAGTRPRGATVEEDNALEADLMADQKELTEHLMLLDLGRNDTGKVSKIGTVRPTEQFIVERYSHVMHIVSNVVGELADDQDALSAFFAGMPAGTVSGAPKVRAMEIIDELEPEKRGVYGGGCGYFSANGDMDMCIALRTAVLKGDQLYIQAGGGVVYDSDPEAEYMETVHKSGAIRRAAADASMFRSGNS